MALFVIALGVLMMGVGTAYLLFGFDIVMTERGAAMTIGGAVALSGGVVTLGIGFALLRLTEILRTMEAAARAAVPVADDAAAVGEAPAPESMTRGAAALGLGLTGAGISAAVAASQQEHATPVLPVPEAPVDHVAPVEPLEDVVDRLLGDPELAEGEAGRDSSAQPVLKATDEPVEDSPADAPETAVQDPEGDFDAAAEGELSADKDKVTMTPDTDEQDAEITSTKPSGPTVLGNYRAGGRTYTMYSNGTVEAATEGGVERFDSMQALRDHLAKT